MSRRTAVEDLFNYSSRGGEARRGEEKRKKRWLLGGGKKESLKWEMWRHLQNLVLGHFQFAAKVFFLRPSTRPTPACRWWGGRGGGSVTAPFFSSLIICSCLLETCCRVLRTGRVTGHQYQVRHPVIYHRRRHLPATVHPHRMYRCARSICTSDSFWNHSELSLENVSLTTKMYQTNGFTMPFWQQLTSDCDPMPKKKKKIGKDLHKCFQQHFQH